MTHVLTFGHDVMFSHRYGTLVVKFAEICCHLWRITIFTLTQPRLSRSNHSTSPWTWNLQQRGKTLQDHCHKLDRRTTPVVLRVVQILRKCFQWHSKERYSMEKCGIIQRSVMKSRRRLYSPTTTLNNTNQYCNTFLEKLSFMEIWTWQTKEAIFHGNMELIHEILTNVTHQHYIQYDLDKATFKVKIRYIRGQ